MNMYRTKGKLYVLRKTVAILVIIYICAEGFAAAPVLKKNEAVPMRNQESEEKQSTQQVDVEISGHISVYGSEPHTFIGIVSDDGRQYTIKADPDVLKELRLLQGKHIRFTGSVVSVKDEAGFSFQMLKDGVFVLEVWGVIP